MHLEELWNFSDLTATEGHFVDLLADTIDSSDQAEILTQLARVNGLRAEFGDAHQQLDEAAKLGPSLIAETRIVLERGRCHNSAGERQRAISCFHQAIDLASRAGDDYLAIDALHMLAIAESPQNQVAWAEKALALARASSDPRSTRWLGPLLNNLGWSYHDLGDFPNALATFESSVDFRRDAGEREPHLIAQWAVGRCQRSMGNVDEALRIQLRLLADRTAANEVDVYVLEELTECYVAIGDASQAADFAEQAVNSEKTDKSFPPDRLLRLAELAKQ